MSGAYPTVRLRHLAQFNPAVPEAVASDPDNEWPLLPMEKIGNFAQPTVTQQRSYKTLSTGYSYLEQTDVAYAKVTPCFENGKGLIGADLDGPVFATTEVTVLRPNPGMSQRFLAYIMQSEDFRTAAIASMTGAGGLRRVSESDMKNFRVPAPDLSVQSEIADYLDHETAEIDALTKDLISLQELTSEELEAEREYLLGLSEPGLIWTRLKFLSGVTVGIVVNPSAWYVESGVPALRGTNVKPERMVLSDLIKISKEGHAFHRKSALSAGDVVIVRTGQAGAAATVPKSLDGSNAIDLLIAKPGPSLSGNYLAAYINSSRARHQFQAGTVGAIQGHFNVEDLKNLEIPVMSLCEQTARVNSWAAERKKAHALVEAISSAVQLTRERRAALITAAVTGQIDVTARHKPAAEQLEDDIAQGLHREN